MDVGMSQRLSFSGWRRMDYPPGTSTRLNNISSNVLDLSAPSSWDTL